MYDFNTDIENAISNTYPTINELTDKDKLAFNQILQSVDYKNYKTKPGERKLRRCSYINKEHQNLVSRTLSS